MTEEERLAKEKADAARADAEEPEWSKKLSAKCDAVMARMDSMPSLVKADGEETEEEKKAKADKARADEEKAKADKARADAEEEERKEKEKADKARADAEAAEKEKADKARADAEAEKEKEEAARADSVNKIVAAAVAAATTPLKDQLAALTGAVHISDEDRVKLAEIQARADGVALMFGKPAPQPMAGETPINYRKRLAAQYKVHSKSWKDVEVQTLADSVLGIAEDQIYADAFEAASHPAEQAAGVLRPVVKRDRTGREITEFIGSKSVWMDQFKAQPQLMTKLSNGSKD